MDQRPKSASGALAASRAVTLGRRVLNPLLLRTGIAAVLEVPGRSSGRDVRVTLAPWQVDGVLYLMSQYGVTGWVRNLRAAGRGTLRYKGSSQAFNAIEVEGEERDRVIALFRSKADRMLSRDFDRLPNASDHPTFRVDPTS